MDKWRPICRKKSAKRKSARVPGHIVLGPLEENEKFLIGNVKIGNLPNQQLPAETNDLRAQIKEINNIDYLAINDETIEYLIELMIDTQFILGVIECKKLRISFKQVEEEVYIHIYIFKLPLNNLNIKTSVLIRTIFKIILKIGKDYDGLYSQYIWNSNNESPTKKHIDSANNVRDVYKLIRDRQNGTFPNEELVKIPYLKPNLRPYQKQAVIWMLNREKLAINSKISHPCYEKVILPSGVNVFYNQFSGEVILEAPMVVYQNSGGILADEMGLGKTIEVLASILSDFPEGSKPLGNVEIVRQRKRPVIKESDLQSTVVQNKKVKLAEMDVSKFKGSALKTALTNWYNDMLVSVNSRSETSKVYNVLCVCGCTDKNQDLVTCVDCAKKQHRKCMGYKTEYGEYRCPHCWKSQPLLKTNATLIVCPQTLCQQWMNEISKHVECKLQILFYEGCNALTPTYPVQLQQCDIVLTTYTVLQNEFKYVEQQEAKQLRKQQKYSPPGSPIVLVHWKRLYIDEAQVVESTATIIAEMTACLTADHRWAVTGTPISVSLADIYGLISYLQITPFNNRSVFDDVLYKPFTHNEKEPFLEFLSETLWRTQKDDVLDQVNIPSMSTEIYKIEFNHVENYFYNRERELSVRQVKEKLSKFDISLPLAGILQKDKINLLKPVVALRKACVHHKIVKGRYLLTRKPVNSMEDLLDALLAKTIHESEEHLRLIVSNLNGLAGISLLLQNPITAIEHYKSIQDLEKKFENSNEVNLHIDSLLLIHANHNFAEILQRNPAIECEETVESLNAKKNLLEFQYLNKHEHSLKQSVEGLGENNKEIAVIEDALLTTDEKCWYSDVITDIFQRNLVGLLDKKVENFLNNNDINSSVFVRNETQLIFRLQEWENSVEDLREESMDSVNDLYEISDGIHVTINQILVTKAVDCHLRPDLDKSERPKCSLCLSKETLLKYEKKLFFRTKGDKKQFSWKSCEEESILSALVTISKSKRLMDKTLAHNASLKMKRLQCLKKEFKSLRKLWTYLDAQICAIDEIHVCKSRLKFKSPEQEGNSRKPRVLNALSYEIENRLLNINEISEYELDLHQVNIKTEGQEASKNLEKSLGSYNYLKSLRDKEASNQPRDPCPICRNSLTVAWNILRCGHSYCINCLQVILSQTNEKKFCCAVCRQKLDRNDINYIETSQDSKKEDDELAIKGYCSSKVERIIKLVQTLIKDDASVKILVFSTWQDVLNLMHDIFTMNNIRSEIVLSGSKVSQKAENFKSAEKGLSVLLLPITLGGKGLNLVEATHVVFVEPLLDPSEELQAIGRVHRIGQEKPITVHKFIMSGSIEEKIYEASISEEKSKWHKSEVTLKQIQDLLCP